MVGQGRLLEGGFDAEAFRGPHVNCLHGLVRHVLVCSTAYTVLSRMVFNETLGISHIPRSCFEVG